MPVKLRTCVHCNTTFTSAVSLSNHLRAYVRKKSAGLLTGTGMFEQITQQVWLIPIFSLTELVLIQIIFIALVSNIWIWIHNKFQQLVNWCSFKQVTIFHLTLSDLILIEKKTIKVLNFWVCYSHWFLLFLIF